MGHITKPKGKGARVRVLCEDRHYRSVHIRRSQAGCFRGVECDSCKKLITLNIQDLKIKIKNHTCKARLKELNAK